MTARNDRWRPVRLAAVAALVTVLAAGCATSVDGRGRPGPAAIAGAAGASSGSTSGSTAGSTAGGSASASASASPSATVRADDVESTDELVSLLVPLPSGAREDTSAYGANRTPTLSEFAERVYRGGGSVDPTQYLSESGVNTVVHRGWAAADGNAADVALLLFADNSQPGRWLTSDSAGLVQAGAKREVLTAVPAASGYTFTQKSDRGSTVTRFLLTRGKVGVLVDYFYQGTFDPSEAAAWVGAQDALLR